MLLVAGCGEATTSGGGGGIPDGGEPTPSPTPVPSPAASRFDLGATTEDFWAAPWPFETRRTGSGTVDLGSFPNPTNANLLRSLLGLITEVTPDFGTNSPIYLAFDGGIDPETLPGDPAATLEDGASVQLVNVEPGSPEAGERVPLQLAWRPEESIYLPENVLIARPFPGFPMRGGDRYALVVTEGLKSADGSAIEVAPELAAALGGEGPLAEHFALVGELAGVMVHGSVFRVQDPIAELRQIRDFVAGLEVPRLRDLRRIATYRAPRAGRNLRRSDPRWKLAELEAAARTFSEYRGSVQVPQLQSGEPPYINDGGEIAVGPGGEVEVATNPKLTFALSVPAGDMPEAGWPLVLYAHGTFGDYRTFLRNGVARNLAGEGIAGFGISQVVHAERNPNNADESLLFFNIVNPIAARDNMRQGAIDYFTLTQVAQTMRVPASVSHDGREHRFDPSRIYFMGHSQGGLTGPLFIAAEPAIEAAMFSGSGGSFTEIVLSRKDPLDLRDFIETLLQIVNREQLDGFHPVLAVLQTFVEPADPINYARGFVREPPFHEDGTPSPTHIFMTSGLLDVSSPPEVFDPLAVAAELTPRLPIARDLPGLALRGITAVEGPISGNLTGLGGAPITGAFTQYPQDGHFAIFRNGDAARAYPHFFRTLVETGSPVVP